MSSGPCLLAYAQIHFYYYLNFLNEETPCIQAQHTLYEFVFIIFY